LEALDLVLVDFLLRGVALRRERGFRFAFFLVPGLVPGDEILLIFASELGDPSSDWVSLISSSNHDWMSPSSSSALLTCRGSLNVEWLVSTTSSFKISSISLAARARF
jgi:hypothetical protein